MRLGLLSQVVEMLDLLDSPNLASELREYVIIHGDKTVREPTGVIKYPILLGKVINVSAQECNYLSTLVGKVVDK